MANKNFYFPKSRIMAGLQCPKRLWLEVNPPEEEMPQDEGREFFLNQGHMVGQVARELYPEGILLEIDEGLSRALAETEKLLKEGIKVPLFEATFKYENTLVRADLLFPEEDSFRLVEVKAATEVREYHIYDCAVQAWVIENAGYPLRRIELAHVNRDFVYPGGKNYQGLLKFVDITEEVRKLLPEVPSWIEKCRKALEKEPEVTPGSQCKDPYECPFTYLCWEVDAEYPVTCLPYIKREKARELLEKGIKDIRDIPEDFPLSNIQRLVWKLTRSGELHIASELREILKNLKYPRYYLDFETIYFVVPIWVGTRPYQQIPFQWSCHIEKRPGEVLHKEFLEVSGDDPRKAFLESLLETLGDEGPIIVYGDFEEKILKSLAESFPEFRDRIEKIISRLMDLCKILKKHFYHPAMKGSWSLKKVLPAVAP